LVFTEFFQFESVLITSFVDDDDDDRDDGGDEAVEVEAEVEVVVELKAELGVTRLLKLILSELN